MIAELKPYPEYRTAEGEWLGEIPAHWTVRRMKYVVLETDARSTSGREQLLRISQYTGVTERQRANGLEEPDTRADSLVGYKRVEPDDLVINIMLAWNGSMGVSKYSGIASPAYCVYRFRRGAHPWYFHHLLRSPAYKARIKAASTGVVESRLRLYSDDLGRIEAMLPPPAEQAAIVRFLDWANGRLERAIRAKRKVIALLGEQKQAIIHRAVTRGLDSFRSSNRRVTTAQGRIPWLTSLPEHWGVLSSRRLFLVRKELALPGDVQLSATQAYGVIPQAEFEQRVGRRVVKVFMHLEKRRHVEKDDFVISMRSFEGGLERAWASGCIRSSYVVMRPVVPVDIGYFSYLFKSQGYIKALQATSNFIRDGQDLNYGNFCLVDLPVPPVEEQKAIADFLDQATVGINTAINRACREVDLLREYRTRLVADVVTGKLDVREAAARLPDEAPPDTAADDSDLNDDPEAADEEAPV